MFYIGSQTVLSHTMVQKRHSNFIYFVDVHVSGLISVLRLLERCLSSSPILTLLESYLPRTRFQVLRGRTLDICVANVCLH